MTNTHQEDLFAKLRVLWFFIELKMLFFIMISRQRRQQKPAPAQPAPPPQPQSPPRRRRKPQNPWVLPWILHREERGCYRTLLDELITTDIPSYRNLIRMPPAFLTIKRIYNRLKKSNTNFTKTLEVGLKLAVTLRHLSTGESYTTLQYQWRVGRTNICKCVPKVCKAILAEFQQQYLICPTVAEHWRVIEQKFRNR